MSVAWKKGIYPASLLSFLESRRTQDDKGKVSYTGGFGFNEEAFILSRAVEMNAELTAIDKQRLVMQALF